MNAKSKVANALVGKTPRHRKGKVVNLNYYIMRSELVSNSYGKDMNHYSRIIDKQ